MYLSIIRYFFHYFFNYLTVFYVIIKIDCKKKNWGKTFFLCYYFHNQEIKYFTLFFLKWTNLPFILRLNNRLDLKKIIWRDILIEIDNFELLTTIFALFPRFSRKALRIGEKALRLRKSPFFHFHEFHTIFAKLKSFNICIRMSDSESYLIFNYKIILALLTPAIQIINKCNESVFFFFYILLYFIFIVSVADKWLLEWTIFWNWLPTFYRKNNRCCLQIYLFSIKKLLFLEKKR